MGFEFKLQTKLTEKNVSEIEMLLENDKAFDKKYEFQNKIFWEFKQVDNQGGLPNLSIVFENDGLYICQYGSSDLWAELAELKDYLDRKKIAYKIIDLQE